MSLKRKSIIGIIAASLITIIILWVGQKTLSSPKSHTVKRGKFEASITVKGEIQGKNAEMIVLPENLKHRDLQIHNYIIKDLIKEGSIVKRDDWIATLDIDNINQNIQNNKEELERNLSEFTDTKIDTAIELTQMREELKEFKYDLEYRKLDMEQAKFESPAYQRKVEVAYNKTVRQIEKKRRDYELRKLHLSVRTRWREERYNYNVHRDSLLKKALVAAQIKAPNDGMVMYARYRRGRKIKIGDDVSPWNPSIAELPDLSTLVSETYIEEIHITKLTVGDSVLVKVDAVPDQTFRGFIYKIANMGQEITGFESNVFNILIELNDSDPRLKPGMSSLNTIIIQSIPNALTIPRECLFSENETSFVYLKKAGEIFKKAVTTGPENDREIIIESGLQDGDKILVSPPEETEKIVYLAD